MKIHCHVTLDDLMAFQKYYLDSIHFFGKLKLYNIIYFFLMVMFFMFFNFNGFSVNYVKIVMYSIIFVVFTTIFLLKYEKKILSQIRSAFLNEDSSLYTGEIDLYMDENGLIAHKWDIQQSYSWQNLLKFRQSKEHIFIFISEMSAYIIPKKECSQRSIEKLEHILEEKIKDK